MVLSLPQRHRRAGRDWPAVCPHRHPSVLNTRPSRQRIFQLRDESSSTTGLRPALSGSHTWGHTALRSFRPGIGVHTLRAPLGWDWGVNGVLGVTPASQVSQVCTRPPPPVPLAPLAGYLQVNLRRGGAVPGEVESRPTAPRGGQRPQGSDASSVHQAWTSGKPRSSSCPRGPSASAASTSMTRGWWSTTAMRRSWPGGRWSTSCMHSWSCT